jgi:hypothetical protein
MLHASIRSVGRASSGSNRSIVPLAGTFGPEPAKGSGASHRRLIRPSRRPLPARRSQRTVTARRCPLRRTRPLLRPSIVVSPHIVGAKNLPPGPLARRPAVWPAGLAGSLREPALPLHHRGHRYLVRLLADLGLRGDHRGGGVRAGRAASRRTWFPSAFFAPRIALPSSLTCISAEPGQIHQPGSGRHAGRFSAGIGQYPPDHGPSGRDRPGSLAARQRPSQ